MWIVIIEATYVSELTGRYYGMWQQAYIQRALKVI